MTDETRETLTKLELSVADNLAHEKEAYGSRIARVSVDASDLAALRDVLTPRTCAGCKSRHEATGACYRDVQDPEGEEVTNTRSPWNWRNRDTFGCSDWQPREGDA